MTSDTRRHTPGSKTRAGRSEQLFTQRREIYERVCRENCCEPQVVRMAKSLAAFLREKDMIMLPEDLFAGHAQYYDFELSAECVRPPAIADAGDLDIEEFLKGYRVGLFYGGLGGHVIAGYEHVLQTGFGALANTARDKLKVDDGREHDFARASLIVCEAATNYALRYAQRANELSQQVEMSQSVEDLRRIANACTWIASNAPRNLFEAMQLLWLTHEIITCEQSSGSLSLGRVDQYLYPYYAHDLASGALSHEEAGELIDAFWVKLNGIKRGFQHVVLGGCDRDGNYAANDLTYLCLRATRKLKMDQPLISVRWRPEIPMALWDEILDLIQAGMGFPALFNDAVAIAAKQRLGVSGTDALVAIKRLVFQARKTSLTSLAEALRMNFARAMPLRKALLICPKYGNDMPDPDELMRDLVEFVCCKLEQYRNPRGGRFKAGMYTVETHAFMGKLTGALPDGRLRGLALANGHSPAQGADLSGPTAVVKSATQYDHRLLGNGMVLDLKFHPMFFSDPDALRALRHLVETYFRLGGMEIQFNVVSRETLVAAKKAPWDYRDLLVRVSGFSAYFVDLDGVTQDELIARVEHSTMSPSTVEAA